LHAKNFSDCEAARIRFQRRLKRRKSHMSRILSRYEGKNRSRRLRTCLELSSGKGKSQCRRFRWRGLIRSESRMATCLALPDLLVADPLQLILAGNLSRR
jgi:hypothetical protein